MRILGYAVDLLVVGLLAWFTLSARAGPVNPDISVIGDSRATWSDSGHQIDMAFEELELAFVGPLNPYASAGVYVGIHGTEGIEVEEAKLVLDRYFPGGFGLTAGHYLLDFGQLNQLHAHAYPFVERPLVYAEFFGCDGLRDTGARIDWIAPTEGLTLRASAGLLRGDLFLGAHHHDQPEGEENPQVGINGRIDLFLEPTISSSVLIGGSFLRGEHDPASGAAATWFGIDGKARWDLGPARTLVVNAEVVFGSLEETDETARAEPNGWFADADLRLNRRWNLGGFTESTSGRIEDGRRTDRYGGFVGLALMEETTLFRLVGRVTDPQDGAAATELIVQALFGLGPHQPHRY